MYTYYVIANRFSFIYILNKKTRYLYGIACEIPNPHWDRMATIAQGLSFWEACAKMWEIFKRIHRTRSRRQQLVNIKRRRASNRQLHPHARTHIIIFNSIDNETARSEDVLEIAPDDGLRGIGYRCQLFIEIELFVAILELILRCRYVGLGVIVWTRYFPICDCVQTRCLRVMFS